MTVLIDARIYCGAADLSGVSNNVNLELKADELDATTFNSGGYRERKGGLKSASSKQSGFVQWPNPDLEMFAQLNGASLLNAPVTIANTSIGGTNHRAYVFAARRAAYSILGPIGQLAPMTGEIENDATQGVGRGAIILAQSVTGDVTGTGVQLDATAAGKSALIAIHVFSAGTTATLTVESAADIGFSSPTTRATKVITSTAGSQIVVVAGAITDTFWRVSSSLVTGTFSLAVSVGITA